MKALGLALLLAIIAGALIVLVLEIVWIAIMAALSILLLGGILFLWRRLKKGEGDD